jgi:hypothetical protein
MASNGSPELTVEQGDEIARNEPGERGWYHTKIELEVIGEPASTIGVVVVGSFGRVETRAPGDVTVGTVDAPYRHDCVRSGCRTVDCTGLSRGGPARC